MNTLNKITTRSRWSYAWSVLRVVEAGRIPCVSIQLTLSQLTRRKNVSGPHVPRCTVRHRPAQRTHGRSALRPSRRLRSLSARAGSLRRVGVVPMTMPLSRPTLYPSTVRAALVVFTGRTPIPVLIVHVLSFQTYVSALLPRAPLPVEPLPRSLNDLTSVSWSVRSFAQPRAAARAPQTRPCRPWAADRLRCTPRAW